MASPADIAVYGGAAGGGKSWALLLEPLRCVDVPGFTAVIFRRTSTQVRNAGGLWDESERLYPHVGGSPLEYRLQWEFPSGATISFGHLEHESDKLDWLGAEVALLGFDELTMFSESQFWYMLSRNRSTCGVRPYVRATCNPDADSWVADLVAWWIDQDTGFPIAERSGRIRWFVRVNDRLEWADDPEDLVLRFPRSRPRSFTFIAANLSDNPKLEALNPDYRANLEALPLVDRERLLGGNWKIRQVSGNLFRQPWFRLCKAVPSEGRAVRYWDKAGSTTDGDFSCGVLMHVHDGQYYIADVVRGRWSPKERNDVMHQTAEMDLARYGLGRVDLWIEREPGHNALESTNILSQKLARFAPRFDKVATNKETRAKPLSAAIEAGNVAVLNAAWTKGFIDELCAFPNPRVHDDQVDAASGAFNKLITPAGSLPAGPPKSRKFALTNGR